MVLNMKMIAINKHSIKLKNWSDKMPNVPYSNRYMQLKKIKYLESNNQ